MLGLLQHQSQQSTSPHQCNVYATRAPHKPLRKEALDLFSNMGRFLRCFMKNVFLNYKLGEKISAENSLMCKVWTSSTPLV